MANKLQYLRRYFAPEIRQGQRALLKLLTAGWILCRDVLAVHRPQLAEDEGVKERRHVQHGRLGLLGEAGQDRLDPLRYVRVGLQRDRLTQQGAVVVLANEQKMQMRHTRNMQKMQMSSARLFRFN